MNTEVRKWSKATNYPYGAYVLYTESKELKDIAKRWNDLSGTQSYFNGKKVMGWDLIFPRPENKKLDMSLKRRLLGCCEENHEQ